MCLTCQSDREQQGAGMGMAGVEVATAGHVASAQHVGDLCDKGRLISRTF